MEASMSDNVFEGYEPETETNGDIIKLVAKGDMFQGVVTRIGDVYEGTFGDQYWINVELTHRKGGEVPAVGTDGGYPVQLLNAKGDKASHVQQEIERALRKVDSSRLEEGDTLAVLLVDLIQGTNKAHKPFRKHAVKVIKGTKPDMFSTDGAPF